MGYVARCCSGRDSKENRNPQRPRTPFFESAITSPAITDLRIGRNSYSCSLGSGYTVSLSICMRHKTPVTVRNRLLLIMDVQLCGDTISFFSDSSILKMKPLRSFETSVLLAQGHKVTFQKTSNFRTLLTLFMSHDKEMFIRPFRL
jgi:hypothetical protein